jgi:hypothetical protein
MAGLLPKYIFRLPSGEIDLRVTNMCDPKHPDRLEGHSMHAVEAYRRHFVLAPCISGGLLKPHYYMCIWSSQYGQNSLWNPQPIKNIECNMFPCYFPIQFSGMQFIMAGQYGSAYRAIWNRGDGSPPLNVVIKRIDLRNCRDDLTLVMREKMLLQRLHHEHISSIMMQYNDPSNDNLVYFVLEDGGPSTLDNVLRDAIHRQCSILPSNVQIIMTHVSLRLVTNIHFYHLSPPPPPPPPRIYVHSCLCCRFFAG